MKSKFQDLNYTILAIAFPDSLSLLNPGYELPTMIQKGQQETYLVPYTSTPSDIILYLSDIDGIVDVFAKQCSSNFS